MVRIWDEDIIVMRGYLLPVILILALDIENPTPPN